MSLSSILQILSINVFSKEPLAQLLAQNESQNIETPICNQLILITELENIEITKRDIESFRKGYDQGLYFIAKAKKLKLLNPEFYEELKEHDPDIYYIAKFFEAELLKKEKRKSKPTG